MIARTHRVQFSMAGDFLEGNVVGYIEVSPGIDWYEIQTDDRRLFTVEPARVHRDFGRKGKP